MSRMAEAFDDVLPDGVDACPPISTMASPMMASASAHPSANATAFGRPRLAVSNSTPPRIGMGSKAMTSVIKSTFGFTAPPPPDPTGSLRSRAGLRPGRR